MADRSGVARRFDVVVEVLQSALAALLVALLALGVFDIAFIIAQPFLEGNVTQPGQIIAVITSSVDTILYLLIVVELYHTIIAYVEDRDVIRAVIHAGLIAVARNIITLKSSDFQSMDALMRAAGSYAILLLVFLVGFYVLHRTDPREDPEDE